MTEHLISNEHFEFLLQIDEKEVTGVLTCRRTGEKTQRVPLLEMEIFDRMQERIDLVRRFGFVRVEEVGECSLHVLVRDPDRGVACGIWLFLEASGLRILFPPQEVEDARDVLYRLFAAKILPGLVSCVSSGTCLLPLVSGMTFSSHGQPAVEDRFLIYGEQNRWELLTTMPFCGLQTPTGGWTCIATRAAAEMFCSVSTDGQGNSSVGLHPMLRQVWVDVVEWTNREILIERLLPGEDLVVSSAVRLRRHLIEDLGKATLNQRAEESPECAYQQSAYTMKLFHGLQRQGIMVEGRAASPDELLYRRTMSFAAAEQCLKKLKDAGISRAYLQSVGWNARGHDGAWPTDFPVDERIGGEKGFRALIQTAKSLGYQITTHLNLVMANFNSPHYQPDWVLHDLWGAPKLVGCWSGGPQGSHWGLAVPEELLRARLNAVKDLGLNAMLYLDGMANPLYPNYHPVHKGSRSSYAAGINRFLALAKETFGAVGTEMGYFYCLKDTDSLAAGGGSAWHLQRAKAEWPITRLKTRQVPVWQLSVHDLVTSENQSVSWASTMEAILFGAVPRDEWTTEPGVFPVLSDKRIGILKARYDLCCEQFGHLIPQQIVSWKEPAEEVQETRFADGTVVTADFARQILEVNGRHVHRPEALASPQTQK